MTPGPAVGDGFGARQRWALAVLTALVAGLLLVTYTAAAALAIASLATRHGTARYAAVILLIGLCGVAAGTAVQLRHVLTHPVVADDAGSLRAGTR